MPTGLTVGGGRTGAMFPTFSPENWRQPDNSSRMTPEMGPPYVERQGVVVRRVLLPKTRNHIYYEIDRENGVVMILAVWGAPKGRAPKL
jgi:hypothetical protein